MEEQKYVDLGLPSGTKWATCNVGANKPEDYGDYFTWDETQKILIQDIPQKEEWVELMDECKWQWTTQNGMNGYKVTGLNGNSIFLPAAGYRDGSSLDDAGKSGYYWSSTPLEDTYFAIELNFDSEVLCCAWGMRDNGQTVRLVKV